MTIASDLNKHTYSGNGATKMWPYTFPIFDENDIKVYLTDTGGTVTQIETNFTVDTVNKIVTYPVSGPPLAAGWQITIVREVPLTQEVDLVNQGAFFAEVIEGALDRLVAIAQQINEKADRSLALPISTSSSVSAQLPAPVPNTIIGWNSDATALENVTVLSSSHFSVSEVQAAIDHVTDTFEAHPASAIANTPSGSVSATDVQEAIDQLGAKFDTSGHKHTGAAGDGPNLNAADIINTPSGNISATTVQNAINELDAEKAKLNGDPEQVFNVADATQSSHAVALGQFIASLAQDGYLKLPGGLIIQWGRKPNTSSSVAITFPTPFPNACFAVVVTPHDTNQAIGGAASITQNGFTATTIRWDGSSYNVYASWIAVGY